MNKYIITYRMFPDAENIVICAMFKSMEEAIIYAKNYKQCAFSIEEVKN